MDLRTGRTYATRDEALEDGVPVADLAEVDARGYPHFRRVSFVASAGPLRHQGERERRRRRAVGERT